MLYANGFGPTSIRRSRRVGARNRGTLSPLPAITIGGVAAHRYSSRDWSSPGQFQFNVVVPANAPSGDNPVIATYNGADQLAGRG